MNLRFNKNTQLAILYIIILTICIGIGVLTVWHFSQEDKEISDSEKTISIYERVSVSLSDESESIKTQKLIELSSSIGIKNICGLQNRGNTCFFNSSIQCILSMKELCDHIKSKDYADKSICKAFKIFIMEYEKNSNILNPQFFINAIKHKINLFDGGQHDAQEFILSFFQAICEEDDQISSLFVTNWIETIECKECNFDKIKKVTPEMIQGITICKSIQDGLNDTECKEIINDYICSNCSHMGNIYKERKIKSNGKYLILYILRFNNKCEKINKPILINKILNSCNKTYKLIGIICHVGTLFEGHYWSYVIRNNNWYSANDSYCTQSYPSTECNKTIYLAFYEEMEQNS